MQVAKTPGFEKRAQYYAAKAYGSQLNQGEDYHNLKEIIFIAITDFVMFPDKPDYKSDHVILDKKHFTHDLKDFSFTFLELPKFNKTIEELSTTVEKWAYFFKHAEETHEKELARIAGSDEVIERAYEELNRFSWSKQELFTYEQETKHELDNRLARELEMAEAKAAAEAQGLKKGLEKGRAEGEAKGRAEGEVKGKAEGRTEGIQEEKTVLAKKLLLKGFSSEEVADLTQLSPEAILKIQAHLKT
jgi:predicted transposase/invertase (TIGR01784 family)